MKKAAIYVRVSTDEQAMEGYSLAAQKELLTDHCISEDWEIFDIYEDDGYSGTNIKRPAYARMMNDISEWDVLLVLKIDRIHRNSRNFMAMMDMLGNKGKDFCSFTESLDTTNALGRFVMDMIQRIAQLESEQIGERTFMGMKEKAETLVNTPAENRTMGFNPPFGYVLFNGVLLSVPEELDVISDIFISYRDGSTMDDIAYRLNRSGVLTRKGNPWTVYNIRAVLHNPIYAGFMRWGDVLIRHYSSVAVEPELFNEVQRMAAKRTKNPKNRNIFIIPEDEFL